MPERTKTINLVAPTHGADPALADASGCRPPG
ncbi:MAG: hypothetical protein ACJAVZ_002175 [Afipia broomeae]|jgi:hypothetical protein